MGGGGSEGKRQEWGKAERDMGRQKGGGDKEKVVYMLKEKLMV